MAEKEVGELVQRVEQWVRPEIRALSAYHVPDPGDLIKLDAMENPYTWDEELLEDWLAVMRETPVNRYPDPAANALRDRLRESMQVPEGAEILLGNGSDELIQIVAMAVSGEGRKVMAPEPSFVMYKMIATFLDMDYVGVPLNSDFELDMEVMLAAIQEHQPAVIFLAYPNNPTGNLFPETDIERILNAAEGLVVVDEAYAPFADASFMNRIGEFPNLLVMRTVSKMGLAGLRLGLLAGDPAWLGEFDKLRLPYNINVLTQASADFALRHQAVFDAQTEVIKAERELELEALREMAGLTVYDSRANFILFRTPLGRATEIFNALKEQGVLIKNLSGAGGSLSDCLRVTVGTPEENQAFLTALRKGL